MIRFVIHPGPVKSRTDGQMHYVGYRELIALYRINPVECMMGGPERGLKPYPDGVVHLYPRYDGNYELPAGSRTQEPGRPRGPERCGNRGVHNGGEDD